MPWWPFNFGDNLSEQLVRIETKLDWINQGVYGRHSTKRSNRHVKAT
jgi:uncharacterized protein YfkK (UPF0435 family)